MRSTRTLALGALVGVALLGIAALGASAPDATRAILAALGAALAPASGAVVSPAGPALGLVLTGLAAMALLGGLSPDVVLVRRRRR